MVLIVRKRLHMRALNAVRFLNGQNNAISLELSLIASKRVNYYYCLMDNLFTLVDHP